tara:strand:- start:66041 stop:66340 length:300 start_codon:yes stop_codon:yes gene_type:complete
VSAPQAFQGVQLGLVDQVTERSAAGTAQQSAGQAAKQQAHGRTGRPGSRTEGDAGLGAAGTCCRATGHANDRAGGTAGFPGVVPGVDAYGSTVRALQNH